RSAPWTRSIRRLQLWTPVEHLHRHQSARTNSGWVVRGLAGVPETNRRQRTTNPQRLPRFHRARWRRRVSQQNKGSTRRYTPELQTALEPIESIGISNAPVKKINESTVEIGKSVAP